ncbi:ADP-ribosyltransferase domain-containing protein [Jiangella muralis]|uniref:ADP-ribosyltransferase domain-containing protein n=1 Tax=Jiangella muralis TaxID=702383 RepID=UPI00069F42E3|nr:ADP-ribosyltransferase domain-containing protein [Jiangella muralis]
MVLSSSARPIRSAARRLAQLPGEVHDATGALAAAVLSHVRIVERRAGPALSPSEQHAVRGAAGAMRRALAAADDALTLAAWSAAAEADALLRPTPTPLPPLPAPAPAPATAPAPAPAPAPTRATTATPATSPLERLTSAQCCALHHYTTVEGAGELNAYLRRPADVPAKRRAELRRLVDDATAGLAALPPFTGLAYRGTSLPAAQLRRWRPGVVVADRGFASASASPSVADAFRGGGNAFITVVGHSGADIRALSSFRHEAEVLYPPGTRFRVVDRSWDHRRECWSFLIEEVTSCASTAPSTTG